MKKIYLSILMAFCSLLSLGQNDQILIKISDAAFAGESTLKGYQDYIPVIAANFGISSAIGTRIGGGSPTIKPSLSDFSFVHNGSRNSPIFNFYVAQGKTISKVEIVFLRASGVGAPTMIYKITLNDVIISSVNTSASGDCSSCAFGVENITMNFAKVKWEDPVNNIWREYDIATPIN